MTQKPKILIVDDVEANRISLSKILRSLDAELYMADNGFDALSLALENTFALVLLDVQMPDMDGFEVCEQMRADDDAEQPPIIFISAAMKEEEHRIMGYISGGLDYITKPINPKILLAKVQVFLKLFEQQRQLMEMNLKLENLIRTDSLTGVNNRHAFYEYGAQELDRFVRYDTVFCVALLDIDFFKSVNDTYGHQMGDKVLIEFAQTITRHIRPSDVFARIGGEEFILLTSHANLKESSIVLDKIMDKIRGLQIDNPGSATPITINFSAGLVQVRDTDKTLDNIMRRADDLLYQAKTQGRNRYITE